MAHEDRKLDVKDILDKATTGWQADPAKPTLVVESRETSVSAYLRDNTRTIVIKKNFKLECLPISDKYENRVWTFPVVIICSTEDDLSLTVLQFKEVMDRYTAAPWSTATLGSGTTYTLARFIQGTQDDRQNHFVMDATVQLMELGAAIVIA